MSYAEFNPVFKKMNMKPKGEVEIVLTTSLSNLRGSVEALSEMIDQKVVVSLESTIVTYNVQINARTEKPIRSYKVDELGVVAEVKPEGEQAELDLGLPKEKEPITEVPEEISREIVDDFILSLLAPSYDDLPYPFYAWVDRLREGETYSKLATEVEMSSVRIVELIDEYRSRVAPLAAKWDEWRKAREEDKTSPAVPEENRDEEKSDTVDPEKAAGEELQDKGTVEDKPKEDGEPSDWERKVTGENEPVASNPSETDQPDIEDIILNEKPVFEDIPYDFPALLVRRKSGETWLQIASSIGVTSGQLSAAYSKYKKRIKENRGNGAA